MTVKMKLDFKELDRIAASLNITHRKICTKIAFNLEGAIKIKAPYKTSALKNSVYTVTRDYDGYDKASSLAKTLKRKTSRHPVPSGQVIAHVGPCVDYAEYVEFGTSKMAARPFFLPAAEEITQKYNDGSIFRELIK
jgi:HK97 gp10 family phage protein